MLDESQPVDEDILEPLREGRVMFNGKYQLIKRLGAGGYGVVWSAKKVGQVGRKSEVALKFLPLTLAGNEDEIQRLNEEADKLELLSHENVISYRDLENEGIFWAIVLEYASQGSLKKVQQKQDKKYFEPTEIEGWVKQLFLGLDYLHSKLFLHRDLKPDNILINEDGVLKITDFGLSSKLKNSLVMLSTAELKKQPSGTLAYVSPQVLLRQKYSKEDDFYSLGVTIYQLLTGSTPYEDAISEEVLVAYIKDPDIAIDSLNQRREEEFGAETATILPEWQRLVDALLNYEKEDRPKSGAEAVAYLEPGFEPEANLKPVRKPGQPSSEEKLSSTKNNSAKVKILMIALLVIGVGLSLFLWPLWSESKQAQKEATIKAELVIKKAAEAKAAELAAQEAERKAQQAEAHMKAEKAAEAKLLAEREAELEAKKEQEEREEQAKAQIAREAREARERAVALQEKELKRKADELARQKEELEAKEFISKMEADFLVAEKLSNREGWEAFIDSYKNVSIAFSEKDEEMLADARSKISKGSAIFKEEEKIRKIYAQPIRRIHEIFKGSDYENWNKASRVMALKHVQKLLKQQKLYKLSVDGTTGKGTHQAVLNYQIKNSLETTGYLNRQTLRSLGADQLKEISYKGTYAGDKRKFKLANGQEIAFRWCPPTGEKGFMMGSPANEVDRDEDETQHKVILSKGFWMAETETTQGLWEEVMGTSVAEQKVKRNSFGKITGTGKDHPMYYVSYIDIKEFIKKVNDSGKLQVGMEVRLPTEAEWEYACRAGTSSPFHTGGNLTTDQANYDGDYPYNGAAKGKNRRSTIAVGSLSANAWGLYDMHGNVYEWCSDWYGAYKGGTDRDPTGANSGNDRVLRGGGWGYNALNCRSANRFRNFPSRRYSNFGFRLVIQVQ